MKPLPHQDRVHEGVAAARAAGARDILVTSPTGGGKTFMMCRLLHEHTGLLVTNRRMLLEQTSRELTKAGIGHGILASGHKPSLWYGVQLAMTQTLWERCINRKTWDLPPAELLIVDEAHLQRGGQLQAIREDSQHKCEIGFTATPLDLSHQYGELIIGGDTEELRQCGLLVPARCYGPDEPDPVKVVNKQGDATEGTLKDAIRPTQLFGRVLDHYLLYNPEGRPAILFAASVPDSMWFAMAFEAAGIPAAHIDGTNIWIRGRWLDPTPESRELLADMMQDGRVKITCNRFVLREGINWPWLYHGILATRFGSLSSYLQSVGRLLRAAPGLDHVILQDHGGNWWRFGSPNEPREYFLGDCGKTLVALRERRLRNKQEAEPIRCYKCAYLRLWGRECPQCGYRAHTRARVVLQTDGQLREMEGDIYAPRRKAKNRPAKEAAWIRTYHRAARAGMTFSQAEALFAKENGWYWPRHDWDFMPVHDIDWFRRVADVDKGRLRWKERDQAHLANGNAKSTSIF